MTAGLIAALAAFLTARLDEDEAAARAVEDRSDPWPGQWVADGNHALRTFNGWVLAASVPAGSDFPPGVLAHIARHDPARVLREVEAKRIRIAELQLSRHDWNPLDEYYSCSQAVTGGSDEPGSGCSDPDRRGQPCDCGRDARVERALKTDASVYSDHPGYRAEWAR